MADDFYTRMVQVVVSLLEKRGQKGILRHNGQPIPDVRFVVLDYSLSAIGTGVVSTADRHVYMEPISVQPVADQDLLYIGGVAHKIKQPVNKIDPAGTVLLYELRVSR